MRGFGTTLDPRRGRGRLARLSAGASEVLTELRAVDQSVFEAVASTHAPLLDRAAPALTNVADRSKLWFGIAAGLSVLGGARGRRAALRGVATLAATSLIANQGLKRVIVRPRPDRGLLPFGRNGRRRPTSSSFPSGHAASAAAFAYGASAEWPALTVPLGALAGAVGFSRVATGAHYPSDVAAGYLLGMGVGVWGRKVVPIPDQPVSGSTGLATLDIGARPDGAGVTLFVNPGSRSGTGTRVIRAVRAALPEVVVVELRPGEDWDAVIRERGADAEVLAVAGGDGTVRTVAAAALDLGLPLAVLPAGTFNHFAKDVGNHPLGRALGAIRAGTAVKVDAGYVNDGLFLNTASVGAYTDFVRIREKYEKRIGKPAAAALAALRTLRRSRSLRLRADDVEMDVSLLFVGNGQYLPQGFAPRLRAQLDDGVADLRTLDMTTGLSRWSVIWSLVNGQLWRSPYYEVTTAAEMDVELLDGPVRVARDGELGELADRLRIRVDRRALTVVCPGPGPRLRGGRRPDAGQDGGR
ncbi:phosphatase PAP2 family protein [Propioniciclava coleopterorum]|uniref:Phosphatase PAP2 family protein n=1 Tax=Propioniciclava coleopterorum TaxID=2714937 RepID=A0A6G7YA56_9ACTN|nr:phosphatase PAP2 family protein [Propioniciclava coleopterorum]QIK73685.1 phosphatase PAP2 family protein [Propioniciclava coleopterorum]